MTVQEVPLWQCLAELHAIVVPRLVRLLPTLSMADYLKGLFGAQKASPPANEDGML